MTHHVFSIANLIAMLGWALLVLLPQRRWPAELVSGWLIPGVLAGAYVLIIIVSFPGSSGGFSSLDAVAQLFSDKWLLLAGWLHYLAFDLFVGGWIVRDSKARGIGHAWIVPLLLLTFLFGPAGWLAYLGLRASIRVSKTL